MRFIGACPRSDVMLAAACSNMYDWIIFPCITLIWSFMSSLKGCQLEEERMEFPYRNRRRGIGGGGSENFEVRKAEDCVD